MALQRGLGGDQVVRVTGPMTGRFAQVTGLTSVGSAPGIRRPASSLGRGKMPDPNTRTAAEPAAVAVLLLLYLLFEPFESCF